MKTERCITDGVNLVLNCSSGTKFKRHGGCNTENRKKKRSKRDELLRDEDDGEFESENRPMPWN